MNLKYEDAFLCFKRLSEESKWSTAYHKYVCALINGALNRIKEANDYIKEGLNSLKHKSNPIEIFAVKRLEYFKKNPIKSKDICEFMCVELNFLWYGYLKMAKDTLNFFFIGYAYLTVIV